MELNEIYNFQDTIIRCKIFENRAREMMCKFLYNPRKCISASSLSGCRHRFLSKSITVLPTQAEIVDLFEQTLVGGFRCLNTRLGFDSKSLLLKDSKNEPKENLKLIYKIRNEDKRVVTKILKMDENNQYGNTMTKPLLIASINKSKKIVSMREFDLIIQVIFDQDKIGHLFVVDIKFDTKNVSKKTIIFQRNLFTNF